MNFDPNDLYGVLPALILSIGALLLLTSEVFLRTVKPAVLGPSPGLAEAAQRSLPPGSDAKPQAAEPPPDRRYQAWVAAAFAAAGLWAAVAQMGDPAVPPLSGAAVRDGCPRVAAAVGRGGPAGTGGLLYGAAALLTSGFAFKVAAVPFHMWVPDVYDGAPAPVTGFMAAGVKAAAFAVLVRILVSGFGPAGDQVVLDWSRLVVWLAGLTMLVGNLLAIPQRRVKRMLAYSSIAHAGYLLIAVASMQRSGAVRADATQGLLF